MSRIQALDATLKETLPEPRPGRAVAPRADPTSAAGLAKYDAARKAEAEAIQAKPAPKRPKPLFEATALSMRTLMDKKFAPMQWAVEEYVPEGTILVAGKPKSGKSWFVLNLMLCGVLGMRFLKKPVTRCAGLYLALEDNDRRMQSRMRLLMQDYGDMYAELDRFEYRCEWPAGAEGAAALDEYLAAHPDVKIVAVDVLKNIRPKKTDRSQNDYEKDYEALEPWKQVAQARRVTLLVVHHTRKAEAEDAFDEISGTLGLNGVVDQMIVLKNVAGNHKQATAHFRGRDLETDHELGLELKGGWWELIGTAGQIAATDSRRAVLDVLAEEEKPMTVTDLLKATGKRSRTSLSNLLKRMEEDGLVFKEGKAFALHLST